MFYFCLNANFITRCDSLKERLVHLVGVFLMKPYHYIVELLHQIELSVLETGMTSCYCCVIVVTISVLSCTNHTYKERKKKTWS